MYEIERLCRQVRAVGIGQHELHVGRSRGAGVFQKTGIHIKTDHASGRANPLAQQPDDPAWSAANVETRPALAHTDQFEHTLGIRHHGGALDMQALNFPTTRLDRVAAGEDLRHFDLSISWLANGAALSALCHIISGQAVLGKRLALSAFPRKRTLLFEILTPSHCLIAPHCSQWVPDEERAERTGDGKRILDRVGRYQESRKSQNVHCWNP